jgi:hypothetical protein
VPNEAIYLLGSPEGQIAPLRLDCALNDIHHLSLRGAFFATKQSFECQSIRKSAGAVSLLLKKDCFVHAKAAGSCNDKWLHCAYSSPEERWCGGEDGQTNSLTNIQRRSAVEAIAMTIDGINLNIAPCVVELLAMTEEGLSYGKEGCIWGEGLWQV